MLYSLLPEIILILLSHNQRLNIRFNIYIIQHLFLHFAMWRAQILASNTFYTSVLLSKNLFKLAIQSVRSDDMKKFDKLRY